VLLAAVDIVVTETRLLAGFVMVRIGYELVLLLETEMIDVATVGRLRSETETGSVR